TCDWLAACAGLLRPLYDVMVSLVLQSRWLHTDDTTCPSGEPRGTGINTASGEQRSQTLPEGVNRLSRSPGYRACWPEREGVQRRGSAEGGGAGTGSSPWLARAACQRSGNRLSSCSAGVVGKRLSASCR